MSLEKILILDDEPSNVEALMSYLDECGISYDYENTLSAGAELIRQSLDDEELYGAIVVDNHFRESGFENYDNNMHGIDFANMVLGKSKYMNEIHKEIAKDYFNGHTQDVSEHFEQRIILFSGSALVDSNYDSELYEGVMIAQKIPDESYHSCCENVVVSYLEDLGFTFDEDIGSISEYKEEHDLHDGIEYSMFEEIGVAENTLKEYLDEYAMSDFDSYN